MRRCCYSLLFVPLCTVSLAADVHVSPTGSDDHAGTLDAPVRTLEKARVLAQSLRKGRPTEAVNILLHPGTHTIRKTVAFQPGDSGTAEAPLNILAWHDASAPDAVPLLVGGEVVAGWKKSTFNGRADVWEADLKPLALTVPFRQVYLNGKRLTWARYPNADPTRPYSGGWAYVDGIRPPMYQDIEGERTDTVVLRAQDARSWSRPQDGEVCIFPRYNWWNRIEKIAAYEPSTRTITLAQNMQYAARPEDRFCLMGLREELDAPGEWFQDATGELVARFVCENQGLWKAFGSRGFLKRSDMSDVATAAQGFPCQTAFYLPQSGEADYDARVTELTLHFQFNSSQGWAEISDLHLDEVEPATEWEAWQMAGADTHSVVADPLFVAPERGDFTLQPESPALKLGFEPIPFGDIGPYQDDARATWPIQEAEGVRENPQWLQSVPIGKS